MMSKWKIAAAVVLVGGAVSAGLYAQQGVKPLTAQDYAEIQQLYIRYNWGIDTHADNGMMWAKTFTPDGEFILVGSNKFVGREKLAEFAKLKPGAPPATAPHHYATNIRIEASPEGARGGAYFFNVPTPEPNKPASITATGTYDDVLVKTAEGWRFKTRTFYSNGLPPSMVSAKSSN
jgi:hypothetical protein